MPIKKALKTVESNVIERRIAVARENSIEARTEVKVRLLRETFKNKFNHS